MNQIAPPELDYQLLDRLFDRTKTQVFVGKTAGFLGPLMCSMNFSWVEDIETACTNGVTLWWNPHFYLSLSPETRTTILLHELWHPALLHMLRRGDREPEVWNWAADIIINNMLIAEGYSFKGFSPWKDLRYTGWTTEDVYDDLIRRRDVDGEMLGGMFAPFQWINPLTGKGDASDLVDPDPADEHTILNNVVASSHSSSLSGGELPGEVELTLKRFLSPKLPWAQILNNFFNELSTQDYSWARPNRRYQDMYLPGLVDDDGGLDHLIYYLDVSGSITDGDIIRFHSEFKYVKENFQPEKMTMVQFDTRIQKEEVFLKEDPFEETHVIGRGGTSLVCVRNHIIEHKPTAVVVFSDLCCDVMAPLPAGMNIPIIWVALNNSGAKVNQGQLIHLRE